MTPNFLCKLTFSYSEFRLSDCFAGICIKVMQTWKGILLLCIDTYSVGALYSVFVYLAPFLMLSPFSLGTDSIYTVSIILYQESQYPFHFNIYSSVLVCLLPFPLYSCSRAQILGYLVALNWTMFISKSKICYSVYLQLSTIHSV